jgi:hypothetical protein
MSALRLVLCSFGLAGAGAAILSCGSSSQHQLQSITLSPAQRGRTAVSRRAGAVRRHRLLQHCAFDGCSTPGKVGCLLSILAYN